MPGVQGMRRDCEGLTPPDSYTLTSPTHTHMHTLTYSLHTWNHRPICPATLRGTLCWQSTEPPAHLPSSGDREAPPCSGRLGPGVARW